MKYIDSLDLEDTPNVNTIEVYPEAGNKFAIFFKSTNTIKILDVDTITFTKSIKISLEKEADQQLFFFKFLSIDELLLATTTSLLVYKISENIFLNRLQLDESLVSYDYFIDTVDSHKSRFVFVSNKEILKLVYLKKPIQNDSRVLPSFSNPVKSVIAVKFSPAGDKILLFAGHELNETYQLTIFDALSGLLIKTHLLSVPSYPGPRGLFSPDCKNLVFNFRPFQILDTDTFTQQELSFKTEFGMPFVFSRDSQTMISACSESKCTGILSFDGETSGVMKSFYLIYRKLLKAENDRLALERLDLLRIFDLKSELSLLLGRNYPFNILHFICLYNLENVLKQLLKCVHEDNMSLLYSLLNQKDFLGQTPYEISLKMGNTELVENLVKIHLKIGRNSRFLSDESFRSETLLTVLETNRNLLTAVLNSQLCFLKQRKTVKLSLDAQNTSLLPIYSSKFHEKGSIEEELNKNFKESKKMDLTCQVLMVEGVLYPKNEFLSELSAKIGDNHDIYESPALISILEFKWRSYAKKKFFLSLIKYLVYFILMLFAALVLFPLRYRSSSGYDKDSIEIASLIFDILSLIYLYIAIVSNEIKQIAIKKGKYFTESNWNLLDVLIILLGTTTTIIDILVVSSTIEGGPKLINALKILMFLNISVLWFRMIGFWRGFKTTAVAMRYLTKVYADIKAFLIAVLYIIIGFGLANYLIQTNYELIGIWDFLKLYYNLIVLGNSQYFDILTINSSNFDDLFFLSYFLLFIFLVVAVINLFITIISHTNSKAFTSDLKAFNHERLNLIIEFEETMGELERQKLTDEVRKGFLYVIDNSIDSGEEEDGSIAKEKIREQQRREKSEASMNEINSNSESIKGIVREIKAVVDEIKSVQGDKFQQFEERSNNNFEKYFDSLKSHFSEEIAKLNQKPILESQPSLPSKKK